MLNQDQKLVLLQIASAILFNGALVLGLYYWLPLSLPPLATMAERFFFTLRCQIFPVLLLLAGVLAVANVRFVTPAINPLLGLEAERLQVHLRYLTNTLEQFVLFFFATTILATFWEGERMKLIPIMTLVFVLGRVTFWIGYLRHPMYRSFGTASTLLPNVVMLVYGASRVLLG